MENWLDPAPITRHLRSKASSHLLVAAIHLQVFEVLAKGPCTIRDLQQKLSLAKRPAMVLFPALCAMGFLQYNGPETLQLTPVASFLTKQHDCNLLGYAGLEANDAGVLTMVDWLLNDGPKNAAAGLSYVKDNQAPSPMDVPETARFFTMALAGRARYLSPIVAQHLPAHNGHLLDVAAGTGYYTYEWLLLNTGARATVFDTPAVLEVAAGLLDKFCNSGRDGATGVKERVAFVAGDMFTDTLPQADLLLAASLFHDWPEDTCYFLAQKFAAALKPGGQLWIHDAFLNDELDGPLAITDYSAMLFLGTRGRAYSRKEYRTWMQTAGLINSDISLATGLDYGLISASKPI